MYQNAERVSLSRAHICRQQHHLFSLNSLHADEQLRVHMVDRINCAQIHPTRLIYYAFASRNFELISAAMAHAEPSFVCATGLCAYLNRIEQEN